MGRPEERKVRENDRNRIKLGALSAPSRLTSPCEARRRVSKMHLLVLCWCLLCHLTALYKGAEGVITGVFKITKLFKIGV